MNNETIKNKVIGTTAIILGDMITATKTLIFAKIAIKIALKTNLIIGSIALVGMEHVYHELGVLFVKNRIR